MSQDKAALPRYLGSGARTVLLAGMFAGSCSVSLQAQQAAPSKPPSAASAGRTAPAGESAALSVPSHFPKREQSYYQLFWGVDSIRAKAVESGELIKFSYRVLDPGKSKPLNEKSNEPVMYDPAIRAKLVIPSLEKVGQLRQTSTPEAGKIYWMAFSNPGRVVKRGDRVSVVIGQFHIEGLVVE